MQHNHHCRLSFHGRDWFIYRIRHRRFIDVILNTHCAVMTIDTIDVDWDAYCEAARAWDERRFN